MPMNSETPSNKTQAAPQLGHNDPVCFYKQKHEHEGTGRQGIHDKILPDDQGRKDHHGNIAVSHQDRKDGIGQLAAHQDDQDRASQLPEHQVDQDSASNQSAVFNEARILCEELRLYNIEYYGRCVPLAIRDERNKKAARVHELEWYMRIFKDLGPGALNPDLRFNANTIEQSISDTALDDTQRRICKLLPDTQA
ncbi:hypothetical protein BGX33_002455 [Mortierella sp. NVP41]|nr:hypothetical protein BGX33_002455 [Mortierella sp. NVP41]